MAAPKVFLTGTTGYIGGDGLYVLYQAHPDWEFSALVRTKEKATQLVNQFPKVRIVYGDLDSADILEEEAIKADIVYHFADADHEGAARALLKGLSTHTPDRPGWYIHTSGTGVLLWDDISAKSYGIRRSRVYDDWDGIGEVQLSIPDHSPHRKVDKIVLAGIGSPGAVKTAIVCPPAIYGPGRGSGNVRSAQVYRLAAAVLKRQKGFLAGEGNNIWHEVHVRDLSNVFLLLGEAAAAGGGSATWGNEGYYFAESGEFVWGDIERAVAKAAFEKKLIPTGEVDVLEKEQIEAAYPAGTILIGSNSRAHAIRAKKLLGWKPQQPSLSELIPDIVDIEAQILGLVGKE